MIKKALCALTLIFGLQGMALSVQAVAENSDKEALNPLQHIAASAAETTSTKNDTETPQRGILDPSYQDVSPLSLLRNVEQWLEKKISFEGTFNSFSPYALDYQGAMRSSKDYISLLIKRPDVSHHVIPLSELKLILPRKNVDKVMDLESGDTILIRGKVFSAALGDPWVDVDEIVLLQKSPENIAKSKGKKNKGHDLE